MTGEEVTVRLGRPRWAALCETQTIDGDGGMGKGDKGLETITYLPPRDIWLTITQPAITSTMLFIEESFQDVCLSVFINHY